MSSHNRSTSIASIASVASFKTAHSVSPVQSPHAAPQNLPTGIEEDRLNEDRPDREYTQGREDMILTQASPVALGKAAGVPLPPTPPPRRRTLLLGKGLPQGPPHGVPPREGSGDPVPVVPESAAHDVSQHSQFQRSQTSTSSEPFRFPQTAPTELENDVQQHNQTEQQPWSRPPRSQARQVSRTMQMARGSEDQAPSAPFGSASSIGERSVHLDSPEQLSGEFPPHDDYPTQPEHGAQYPDRGEYAVYAGNGQADPTHYANTSRTADADEEWVSHVKAQLMRVFPEFATASTLLSSAPPATDLRSELSSLREEMSALRGVVGELRGEIVPPSRSTRGGTAPLSPVEARSHARTPSIPGPSTERVERTEIADDLSAGVSSRSPAPRRPVSTLMGRERLSMYRPSAHEPQVSPDGGLVIFDNETDEPITLRPSCISLMLDVVRTVDMRVNGVRTDAEIFSDDNLANLAISQVMD